MAKFIEFPIFTGVAGELRPWISWLEAFFVREKFTKLEKMNLAQSLLEGEAEAWFYIIQKTLIFYSWKELKDKLLLRFGDFADSDRIRLIAEQDRFLQEIRDEARIQRRKRMSRTAITPQESISSSATIPETITVAIFSNPQVDEISAEKKESKQEVDLSMEKIASQLKLPNTTVHVSDSENLGNIETRIENSVLDNFESVVKEAKIQTNIRLDVVNGDDERIQRVMSSSKHVSAHQVLDKMCQLKRLKPKNKRKLSLSPKSRMFKFKNKMLQRNRSQMDPHHVMDSNIVTHISSSSRAKFGFKWKEHNSRYWRRMRQTRLHMRHKWKFKHLRAVVGLQNNPSYALDVVTKPIIECNTTAAISQLVLDRSASHDCFLGSLWEKNSWCGWLLFDRGKTNIISGNVIILGRDGQTMLLVKAKDTHVDSLMCGDVTFFLKHKWRFKYKGRLQKIKLTDTMFLWEKVYMVSCLSLDAQFHSLAFQLKHKWRSKNLYTMSALEFQVVELIGVVVFKDQPLPREIAAELASFALVFVIVILVVIDRLSKAVHVLGLKHPFKPGWEIGVH